MGGCKNQYYTGNIPKRKRIGRKKREPKPPSTEPRKNSSRIKICIVKNDKTPASRRSIGGLKPVQQYKSADGDRDVFYLPDDINMDEFHCFYDHDNEDTNTQDCKSIDTSNSDSNETTGSECSECKNKTVDNHKEKPKTPKKCHILDGKDYCYAKARGNADEIPIGKFDPVAKKIYGTECDLPCINQGGVCKSYPMYCCTEKPEKSCDEMVSGLYCRHSFGYYENKLKELLDKEKENKSRVCCSCLNLTDEGMVGDVVRNIDDMSGCGCGNVCPAVEKYVERKGEEVYKFCTRLENWKPGKIKICCPICSVVDSPAIKQTKKRALIANTGFQASILVAFWPLCMLPFMMTQCRLLLFCKSCKNYLGQYDKRKGCVMPPEPLKEQIAKIIYKDNEEVFD
ncbi:unnamed protein product [Brassicogethes aeneus]|uniref:LITAF domain-containing protein n=1 Tax=Brassicogethes aeneus TaxID=1431903 RepID=A0A9P0B0H6_BRAAE|nr:unnamed protein product [Brassicogethes aeneus]